MADSTHETDSGQVACLSRPDVADGLRSAAGLIARDGWARWEALAEDGTRSISGALTFVATRGRTSIPYQVDEDEWDRLDPLATAVEVLVGWGSLAAWNEADGRTAAEVIAALRAAADRAEAQS